LIHEHQHGKAEQRVIETRRGGQRQAAQRHERQPVQREAGYLAVGVLLERNVCRADPDDQ
jgi:hypothetical protein